MAADEQPNIDFSDGYKGTANWEEIIRSLGQGQGDELEESEYSKPDVDVYSNLLNERKEQRNVLFSFSRRLVAYSLCFLLGIISIQSAIRIGTQYHDFILLSERTIEILAVSVFGNAIGVIYIITRRLWDDTPYLDLINPKKKRQKH